MKWAGVEYIDLNELSAGDLMNGLEKAVCAHAKDVLAKYNAMRTAFASKKPADILEILKSDKPDKDAAAAKQAFEEWNQAAAWVTFVMPGSLHQRRLAATDYRGTG